MKTHGPPTVFDDQAAKMLVLMGELANKKRSTTSGVRQPAFLRDLLSMIDPSEDDGKNDGSEEPLMEASPQRRSKQLVAWSPETAEKTAAPKKSGQQSAQTKNVKSLIRRLSNTDSEVPQSSSSTNHDDVF